MRPSQLLTGIIIFIIVTVGGFAWLFSSFDNTATLDAQQALYFNKSLARAEKIQATQTAMAAAINTSASDSESGSLDSLIQTSWSTLKTLPSYFGFFTDIMTSAGSIIGISDIYTLLIISLIGSMITISVIFAIFSAIFQKEL